MNFFPPGKEQPNGTPLPIEDYAAAWVGKDAGVCVFLKNVVHELYSAALNKEITFEQFLKCKEICRRAKPVDLKHPIKEREDWISCEEQLPDGKALAINATPGTKGYGGMLIGYVGEEDGHFICAFEGEVLLNVSHWMPPPQEPNARHYQKNNRRYEKGKKDGKNEPQDQAAD